MADDLNIHNKIAELCLNCFKKLPKSGKPNSMEWTVLSCIVLENDSKFKVVALGTGTKCVGKNKMSENGDILNDSHAEVICRRGFLRYLYSQMKHTNSFFRFNAESKKFSLKNEAIKFHFFTTHIPCGDAAIFPMQNPNEFGDVITEVEEVPRKKNKLDVNRTGAKCLGHGEIKDPKLPGELYHVVGVVRTKPGRGDPTLSVSCSDKLSRWFHMGLQGALLSILLEKPIYISTFTILSNPPFCNKALKRALFDRLGSAQLAYPYSIYSIAIGSSKLSFDFAKDNNKKPSPLSISWCDVGEKCTEISVEGRRQGITKKKMKSLSARLTICKIELFKQFKEVCYQNGINAIQGKELITCTYSDIKRSAVEYQLCWNLLKKKFGCWTNKNEKMLEFI